MSLITEKVAQASGLLREFGFDAWITFTRESAINGDPTLVFLAPGDVTWHSAFVVDRSGGARAIVGRYDRQAVADTGAYTEVVGYVTGIREPLQAALQALDPKTIAVNWSEGSEIADGLTHGMFLTLRAILGEIGMAERMVSAEPVVSALRERKSAGEIALIEKAVQAAERVFGRVEGFLGAGRTEKEVADFMVAETERMGLALAWSRATCPAVFTGPETAEAHYSPTGRAIERGHVVNMDFGVKVDGYCSDLQRTYYVLRDEEDDAPEDVRRGFDTIVRAIAAAKAAMRPGARGVDVDKAARDVVVGAGYEEFPHALGHQVGRYAHDGTALLGPLWDKYAQKPLRPLEEGMVFTLEPRLKVPGKGIVTVEDMVVVRADGAEWISRPQTRLVTIR